MITKSPRFNAGIINSYRKNTFRNNGSGNEENINITIENGNPAETVISRNTYSNNLVTYEYDWYGLQDATNPYNYTYYFYDSYKRLSYRQGVRTLQKDGEYTRLYNSYTYHPDNRLNIEMTRDGYHETATKVTTTYNYDSIKKASGTTAIDYYNNTLYHTHSKSNGLGDVIYTIDRNGVASGKEYDSGGKVASEFIFADAADTVNFDDASFEDVSGVYANIDVISQTKYIYDANGRLESVARAVSDSEFHYGQPQSWRWTNYGYDPFGRKVSVIEDVNGADLQTSYEYDNQGQIEKTTLPNGKWTKTERNGRGLVSRQIVGYGQGQNEMVVAITEFKYDENGNMTEQKAPNGIRTQYEYDDFDRVSKVTRGM